MEKTREIVEITATPADGDGAIIFARCADGTLWQGYTGVGAGTVPDCLKSSFWDELPGIPIDGPNSPQRLLD